MVARKAHNLEVTGSNPVSARFFCKKKMKNLWVGQKKRRKKIESLHYSWSTISNLLNNTNNFILNFERIAGIEPASSPWQREILPFDYIRILSFLRRNMSTYIVYMSSLHLCRAGPDTVFNQGYSNEI